MEFFARACRQLDPDVTPRHSELYDAFADFYSKKTRRWRSAQAQSRPHMYAMYMSNNLGRRDGKRGAEDFRAEHKFLFS
jgi:hypothetical protein